MRTRSRIVVGCVVALGLGACRSIEGRYVDPEGLRHGCEVGGAPVIVERPRWLLVTHRQQTLALMAEKSVVDEKAEKRTVTHELVDVSTLQGVKAEEGLVRTSVDTEILTMGEMYALDFMRPFAGSSDHALEWHDAQSHPKKITQKVEDKTLDSVLSNLDKIKDFVGAGRAPAPAAYEGAGAVVVKEAITRIELYDLYDLAKGVVRAVWVQHPNGAPLCAPPCGVPPPPPPPCPPRAR